MAVLVVFLLIAFLAGLAGAFQIPTLSLYLSTELSSSSGAIGLFYAVNAITGIAISFWLAILSDRIKVRRRLVMFCYVMAIANSLLFAFNRHYLTLIVAGSLLMALANAALPQLFALAREHSQRPVFNSLLRAQLSLAWVAGPPLAFVLVSSVGFKAMYLVIAGIFIALLLLCWKLPSGKTMEKPPVSGLKEQKSPISMAVGSLFVASVLMWSCSALYLIDIPLYVSQQLGFSAKTVGLMMGLAAAIEIPIMLLVGRYVERTGKKRLLMLALGAGVIFFAGLSVARTLWQLYVLQIFNALFIGIIATVGMFYFQSLLRLQQGMATTLFTNSVSVGIIIAGVLQGILSRHGQHENIYIVAVGFLLIAAVILKSIREE